MDNSLKLHSYELGMIAAIVDVEFGCPSKIDETDRWHTVGDIEEFVRTHSKEGR